MALNAAITFEIRQGGSDTNSGGFKTGATGTDWTQQNAAQYSVTDGVTAGTTTITSATAAFGTDVVGNLIYVQGGTGSVAANWYEITSRTNATTIVVDRSTGLTAGTGVTLKIGGAFGTPGVLASVSGGIGGQLVSGQKAYVKYSATPYAITTATAGPAGPCSLPSTALIVEGYDATRGDRTGNRPTYKWGVAPGSLTYAFTALSTRTHLANLAVDGDSTQNSGAGYVNTGGFSCAVARTSASDCTAANMNGTGQIGFSGASAGNFLRCQSTNCTVGFTGASSAVGCVALGGTTGYSVCVGLTECLAYGITGTNPQTNGYSGSGLTTSAWHRCTADNQTASGFINAPQGTYSSCLVTNCAGTGYAFGSSATVVLNCAYYNCSVVSSGIPFLNEGTWATSVSPYLTALSGDPYTNRAGGDFRPNATAGAGLPLWAAAITTYGQTAQADVGAGQHADPSGAGGPVASNFRGGFMNG